jgi:ABC-type multidrug transport system fused ATPase/permease subunit
MFESIQNNTFNLSQFTKILCVIAFLQIGYALMDLNDSKQIPLFQQKCKEIFIRKIFKDTQENYKELLTGDLMAKIFRSQHIITAWYSKLTTFIIPHFFEFIFTLVYFTYIDISLGLSFGILLFIFTVILIISPLKSDTTIIESDKALNEVHENIDDLLTNYLSIHKENKLENEIQLLRRKNDIFSKLYNKSIKKSLKYRLFLMISMLIFLFVFVQKSYTLLRNNKIKKSLFFALIMMLTNLIGNLLWMIDVSKDVIFDYGSIKNSQFLNNVDIIENKVIPCKDMLTENTVKPIIR